MMKNWVGIVELENEKIVLFEGIVARSEKAALQMLETQACIKEMTGDIDLAGATLTINIVN